MWYEILYDLKSFKGKLGVDGRSNLVFAQKGLIGYDNDPTGYGFQGVFVSVHCLLPDKLMLTV